jgi:hypothetical protein
MSMVYGWRYAHEAQVSAGKKKNVRKNVYVRRQRAGSSPAAAKSAADRSSVRQHYQAQKMAPPTMGVLNKSGRYVVALLLVLITLAVVGKEPLLKAGTWDKITAWLKHPPAVDKARQAGKPAQQAPRPQAPGAASGRMESANELHPVARERAKPLALIADQGLFLLDVKGQIWPLDHGQAVDILPVVTGIRLKEIPGPMGIMLSGKVDTAMVRTVMAQPFSDQLSELHFNNHDLILYTRDGIKIKIDPSRHLPRDLIRLQAVLGAIRTKAQKIASIDMRCDQQLVVRPVGRR